jgi:serpin B
MNVANPSTAVQGINDWARKATHGLIPQILLPGDLGVNTSVILANAASFAAKWQTPFSSDKTVLGNFVSTDGSLKAAEFMHIDRFQGLSADRSDSTAVAIPYQGGKFESLILEPKSQSMPEFVNTLTSDRLAEIVRGLHSARTSLTVPKFSAATSVSLDHALRALGITAAYDQASFGGISNRPLALGTVKQRSVVSMDEQGTTASSVTTGVLNAIGGTAYSAGITIDHPFLMMIRDTQTGAILFESIVTDPSASH